MRNESEPYWQPCTAVNWRRLQVKRAFAITLGKMLQSSPAHASDAEVTYLKAQHVKWDGITLADLPTMWASEAEVNALLVKPGDLLVCEGGEVGRSGIVGVSPKDRTIIQNALHLVRGRNGADPRFLNYLLRHAFDQGWFNVICNKSTIAHFTAEKFEDMWTWLPDNSQQRAIADYLDRETARIDALIVEKEKLLDLLAEKRRALMTRAVTRGVNPNVPLRDSGIPWLGKIPAHWDAVALKRVASLKSGEFISSSQIDAQGDFPVFGGNGLRGYSSSYTHDGEHVLIGRQGALCGNINYASGRFWASEHAVVVTTGEKCMVRWIGELLDVMHLNQYSQSAAQPGLAVEFIDNLQVPIPPIPEQKTVVEFSAGANTRLDNLRKVSVRTIGLLKERRAALIAAAVTGQLEVT